MTDVSHVPQRHARRMIWLAAAFLFASLAAGGALAADGHHPQREQTSAPVRAVALPPELEQVRDGYFSTLGCVAYPEGGMGVHFLNLGLIGPTPDPMRPQILVYEPEGNGRLRLVAAEWFIPLATGVAERPTLFGHRFDGPMEGHEPLMPRELHHYDLHVWLFKENPAGLFAATNPEVSCSGDAYAQMEHPPAIVPHR